MTKSMIKISDITNFWVAVFHLAFMLVALYATSFYSYALFHTLTEIVSVVFAVSIFLVTWNSRRFFDRNNYYLLIGFAFLFSGIIDVIHALEYSGVGVINHGGNTNVATQLWLAGRFVLAATFFTAPFLSKIKLSANATFLFFLSVSSFLLLTILFWKVFPIAYVDGSGLTLFKKISEYFLIALFLGSFAFLRRNRKDFHTRVFRLLELVFILMATTEFLFTIYVGVYDTFNLVGHLLKIVAYYLAYLAIVEFSLMKPYQALFSDLKEKSMNLRRATSEWSLMFNSITDPTFIVDTHNTVTKVNDAMCDFMGEKKENLIGHKCYEFMHKKNTPCVNCPMKITCQSKKPHTEEIYESALNKTLLVTTSPILDEKNEIIGVLHISKDITEKKEVDRAKDEFISLASHQLRTPLASISLASELLLRGVAGENAVEQKEMLNEIHQSTKRMSTLINHMLNISRIELGTMEIQPQLMAIGEQVEEIVGEAKLRLEKKGLNLKLEIEAGLPEIKFDTSASRIIMENLLTNSIRYTPAGGNIEIKLIREESNLLLSVCDTGCGIPKKEQKHIFKKSFRAQNAKLISSNGYGLGLYMVKEIIEKVGASIRFDSQEGKGTQFFVTLPLESEKDLAT